MNWEAGMQAVCVDDGLEFFGQQIDCPKVGDVVTIKWVGMEYGFLMMEFWEFQKEYPDEIKGKAVAIYQARRFRPVKKTDISELRQLLAPVPERVMEDA